MEEVQKPSNSESKTSFYPSIKPGIAGVQDMSDYFMKLKYRLEEM
jgi:hypothetical protein